MPEPLTRAALIDAAARRIHAMHGVDCIVGHNCPGKAVVDEVVGVTLDAALSRVAGGIEAQLRHEVTTPGDSVTASWNKAIEAAAALVRSLMGADDA